MRSTLLTPTELTSEHFALWRQWQVAAGYPPNPFLTPTFLTLVGRHRPTTRVAVIEDEFGIAGFFPFDAAGPRVGKTPAPGLTDVQAPVFRPGFEFDAVELLEQCKLAVFEFDRMLPDVARRLAPRSLSPVASPYIDLSPGYENWLAAKRKTSASRFRRILQKQRQIAKEIGEIEFELASPSHADLERLMAWKSAQFIRTGRRDRFAQAWFRTMLHELLDSPKDELAIVLSTLRAGDRLLAIDLGLASGTTIAGWFPAYDLDYQRYSTGTVCLLMQIEAACDKGFDRMDLGAGEADYKESFKDAEFQVAHGWSERPSATAFLRRTGKLPQRVATQVVLGSPTLRRTARSTLNSVGSVRSRFKKP